MARQNIAFVIHSLSSGGAERVVTNLANEMALDYNITIITLNKGTPFYNLSDAVEILYCNKEMVTSTSPLSSIRNNISLARKLYALLANNHFDLLISFLPRANILTIFLGTLKGIPVIISERINPELRLEAGR